MELKRLYEQDPEGGALRLRDKKGKPLTRPDGFDPATGEEKLAFVYAEPIGVEIRSLGSSPEQHFTPELIADACKQGWGKLDGQTFTLTGTAGPGVPACTVPYQIKRKPGYYCCHCGKPQEDGALARAHLVVEHNGQESPDPQNPAGYERINYFDCVEVNPRPGA